MVGMAKVQVLVAVTEKVSSKHSKSHMVVGV